MENENVISSQIATADQNGWRCFHCSEYFSEHADAAVHFGTHERQNPACLIDISEYRAMEELHKKNLEEDTELHRAMFHLKGEHALALRRAEEAGYARGLLDARKEGTPLALDSRCVEDLSALVRQLVRSLRKEVPHDELADRAMDYLKRKGLQGSPLRTAE